MCFIVIEISFSRPKPLSRDVLDKPAHHRDKTTQRYSPRKEPVPCWSLSLLLEPVPLVGACPSCWSLSLLLEPVPCWSLSLVGACPLLVGSLSLVKSCALEDGSLEILLRISRLGSLGLRRPQPRKSYRSGQDAVQSRQRRQSRGMKNLGQSHPPNFRQTTGLEDWGNRREEIEEW
jgi:hypothetical protein